MGCRLGFAELEGKVVQVAEIPILTRFKGPDDGMTARTEMFRGMPILRAVATPDVAAALAHAQVHPHVAGFEAFLATVAARFNVQDLVEVRALLCQGSLA